VPDNTQKTVISHAEFLEVTTQIQQASSLEILFEYIVNGLNVTCASYHDIADIGDQHQRGQKRYFAHNLPSSVVDFFDSRQDLHNDPGIIHVFTHGRFVWLSDMMSDKVVIEKGNHKRIKSLISSIGDCLLLPLYGPQNRLGYACIGFGKNKTEFMPVFSWQIQSLIQLVHVRYCLMLTKLQKQVRLTNRETEVLELITFGKTNPEIGVILNISPNTVSGYVKQIFLKLGTSDRVTTALRARSLSLIP